MTSRAPFVEWPTLALIIACYLAWAAGTAVFAGLFLPMGILVTSVAIAFFSSLQHEVLHGHPFRKQRLNEALVFPGLTLLIPYIRFRDTHLAHHQNNLLTDPYDDPESNYQDPKVWAQLSPTVQRILLFNNTLMGRLTIGAAVSQVTFMVSDVRLILAGQRQVLTAWLAHFVGVAMVVWWLVSVGSMPIWAYVLAAYIGLSIVKLRTFLEHRAHELVRGRTAIVEGQCFFTFLFLNNNLHVVHHTHPKVPWYRLPKLYADNKDRYLKRNEGYVYSGYKEVFRRYFFKRKDPVPHPFWR